MKELQLQIRRHSATPKGVPASGGAFDLLDLERWKGETIPGQQDTRITAHGAQICISRQFPECFPEVSVTFADGGEAIARRDQIVAAPNRSLVCMCVVHLDPWCRPWRLTRSSTMRARAANDGEICWLRSVRVALPPTPCKLARLAES